MGVLDGKVTAVTGGTRGIGCGIAEGFLRAGARVVLNGRDPAKGELCLKELDAGEAAHFIEGDVTRQSDIEAFVDGVVDRYGRIDTLVLNAGAPRPARLVDTTDEDYDYQVRLNFSHVFWGMRRALRYMIPRQEGRIICISSVEGKMGKPALGIYTACKHGIQGMVKATAREVGTEGITVNAICPGAVMTDAVPELGPQLVRAWGLERPEDLFNAWFSESAIKRPNTVEEIAAMAVLLASDAGSGITGAMLNVDGGISSY
jgi:3-hydroxybutyrate dehydrogenase